MYTECEDLIRRLLCTDPSRRITIPEIVAHRWVRLGGEDPEFDQLIRDALDTSGSDDRTLDPIVVDNMVTLGVAGMDREHIAKVGIHPSYYRMPIC